MVKIDELLNIMRGMKAREPRTASAAEVLHTAGSLIFLPYSCFGKIARGGLRPFYDWVTEHVDGATLWRTKDIHFSISPSLLGALEFFLRALPLLEPRVYYFGRVERAPVVVESDAEWSPPPHPSLTFDRGLGGCIFVDGIRKGCARETPEHICNALAPRQTQIIPL